MLYVKSPCGPCCGSSACTVGTITCVSLEGDGSISGWSKWQNYNSGDWNQRKFTRSTLSFDAASWRCSTLWNDSATCATAPCNTRDEQFVEKVALWDPATSTVSQYQVRRSTSCGTDTDANITPHTQSGAALVCNIFLALGTYSSRVSSYPSDTVLRYVHSSPSPTTCTSTSSSVSCCNTGTRRYTGPTTSSITSEDSFDLPDTVSAALARGTPTSGTNCRTQAGSIGTVFVGGGSGAVSITGTRAVVATIPLSGLTNGVDYTVTAEIDRYTAGGGSYVDTITDEITFTASGTTEDLEYDVPIDTDYDYEITGATCAAA